MRFVLSLILSCMISSSFAANKIPPFTAPDFSGVYACKGLDAHEGEYKGKYMRGHPFAGRQYIVW